MSLMKTTDIVILMDGSVYRDSQCYFFGQCPIEDISKSNDLVIFVTKASNANG